MAAIAASTFAAGGCQSVGRALQEAFRERPPAPLDRMSTASDARIDSAGRLVGSFVGEGTNRAVHLISSDTILIADLLRRYAPGRRRVTDPWEPLSRAGLIRIPLRIESDPLERGPLVQMGRVGSPSGRTGIVATSLVIRGGAVCRGARGARAELVVEEPRRGAGPELRGPVVGSLLSGLAATRAPEDFVRRDPPPAPSDALIGILVDRTRYALDSILARRFASVQARPVSTGRLEVNSLADIDAADVVAYNVSDDRVRYAVSLRERRVAGPGGADTLVAVGVMAWDSAGAWQQVIFRPTYLSLRQGRLAAYERGRALFWRRLAPVSDFGFRRDNLWMEQVDVQDGSVLWGIIQPGDNVVVAAAEMDGPCR